MHDMHWSSIIKGHSIADKNASEVLLCSSMITISPLLFHFQFSIGYFYNITSASHNLFNNVVEHRFFAYKWSLTFAWGKNISDRVAQEWLNSERLMKSPIVTGNLFASEGKIPTTPEGRMRKKMQQKLLCN